MQTALCAADWTRHDDVAVRGRAFDGRTLLEAADLAARFASALETDTEPRLESVARVAASLEGFFAAVVRAPAATYLIADAARSIPLFYDGAGTVVTDRGRVVRERVDAPRDPITESEFLLARYVTGPETIWREVFAVQPSEVVRLGEGAGVTRHTYREYWPAGGSGGGDEHELRSTLESGLETALNRLEAVAGDRPVVVPLSGGYDSRLLAAALVERGREVIGFTFGRSGHPDVEVSREVAARLGIRWECCEYSGSKWREWYHGEEGRRYRERAFGGDALPFLAAWPAVKELLEAGRLPQDGLYCPGHTVATPSERLPQFVGEARGRPNHGATIGCGPAVDADETEIEASLVEPTVDGLAAYVLEHHYALWEWDDEPFRRAARERIERGLLGGRPAAAVANPETAAAAYERWEWRGRMSTFTNGDLRLYEHFGLEWWLPLWDPAYVRAWERVPLEFRRGKGLHADVAVDSYRRATGLSGERAGLTDRTLTAVDRHLSLLRHTPVRQFLERGGDWEPPFLAPRARWREPGLHPLAWDGAVDPAVLERVPPDRNFYALRTLAETGRLDLAEPSSPVPGDGVLELPAGETEPSASDES